MDNKESKTDAAIALFVENEVSLAKAAELSEMSLHDFIHLLKSKDIPWIEYTEEDYDNDNEALEKLLDNDDK